MPLRVVIPLLLLIVALPGFVLPIAIVKSIAPSAATVAEPGGGANIYISIGFGVTLFALLIAWAALHVMLVSPLDGLAREARALTITPQDRDPAVANANFLRGLVTSIGGLARALFKSRSEIAEAVATATRAADQQKSQLETILLDLTEGVIVCNRDHRIILYNEAASRILAMREMTGLGRSVFGVLTREPIVHALDMLARRSPARAGEADGKQPAAEGEGAIRRFMASTADLGTLVETRMRLVIDANGDMTGYVLSFQDIGREIESLAARDTLLREVMVEWRRPLANLSAAVEMLGDAEQLSPSERAAFQEIVAKELDHISTRFAESSRRYDRLDVGPWAMADVRSLDLFRAVQKHVGETHGIALTPVGLPVWLRADSHALMLALEHLVQRLARETGLKSFDAGVSRGDTYAYVEIMWTGSPINADVLESWLDEKLEGAIASRTPRQIIERHGGEVWSTATSATTAMLRLPLRPAETPAPAADAPKLAPRPEYYDFDLFKPSHGTIAATPLRALRYVVFDTETTGLRPTDGDELLSIGAVQVVNGRLLTSETFERLIDPGRDIPELSIRFHGITPDMVKGKPPARIVLPQFRRFVGDAVLVAYNIAFDMKFLTLKQDEAGVKFDNPVLDALLLSIYLYPDLPDHSLNGVAEFLGIEIAGRHTAVGDALATAALWIRLLEIMESRGITTFGEAVAISDRMQKERRLADKF
ncbi:MAG: exonuclease domain-containing protein [Hyphomicrobiaceae bacterium]